MKVLDLMFRTGIVGGIFGGGLNYNRTKRDPDPIYKTGSVLTGFLVGFSGGFLPPVGAFWLYTVYKSSQRESIKQFLKD